MQFTPFRFKPGERVFVRGWPSVGDFIGVVERPSRSGSSYLLRSELPLFRVRTHIKGQVRLDHYYGYISVLDVRELTALDELSQIFREPVGP